MYELPFDIWLSSFELKVLNVDEFDFESTLNIGFTIVVDSVVQTVTQSYSCPRIDFFICFRAVLRSNQVFVISSIHLCMHQSTMPLCMHSSTHLPPAIQWSTSR